MKRLGPSYLWLFSLAVPAVGFSTTACSSDPAAPPGGAGGAITGAGGSGFGGGVVTGTGGASSFGGGAPIPGAGGSTTSSGGSTTGTPTGGTSTTPSGGTPTAAGGSVSTPGGGGSVGTTAGATAAGAPSATGGTGGVSAGGAGGAQPKAKLCATKAPAAPVFVDFETYNGTDPAAMWAFSPVTSSFAGFWAGGTPIPTLSVLAGHAGNYGFNVSVMSGTGTWAGVGTWMNPVTCINASAFTGVTLWVRGTTPNGLFSVHLNLEETTLPDPADAAGGGTCTGTIDTCKSPTASDLPVSVDWTQVTIPWAMFVGGLNGTAPVVVTGDRITGLGINFGFMYGLNPAYVATDPTSQEYIPMPGNIDFSFDDVGFSM